MSTEKIWRPEDVANHRYYNHGREVRRYRVVIEVDAEWRDDDETYAPGCIEVDLVNLSGSRASVERVVSIQPTDEPRPGVPLCPVCRGCTSEGTLQTQSAARSGCPCPRCEVASAAPLGVEEK